MLFRSKREDLLETPDTSERLKRFPNNSQFIADYAQSYARLWFTDATDENSDSIRLADTMAEMIFAKGDPRHPKSFVRVSGMCISLFPDR